MMIDNRYEKPVKVVVLLFLGRLRRQYDNHHMGTDVLMARELLKGGRHRTTVFILVLLLLSSLPIVPSSSADSGAPEEFQAQGISAIYDVLNETTTVTWRNIDQVGGNNQLFRDLWDVTYHLYRHNAPITPANINEATEWASVVACDEEIYLQYVECAGLSGNPHHEGHSAIFEVGAGTNGTYYYAITSEFEGNITTTLDFNASSLYDPVHEVTTPIRSPYNVEATFDPVNSETEVRWINYNDLNIPGMTLLPEDGINGLKINIWRTTSQVTRDTDLLLTETPVATLASSKTSHTFAIDLGTNREVFYSVTYLLPNWTTEGLDYQDTRFLSNNAMDLAILEDTSPPNPVEGVSLTFVEDELGGKGNTTIEWNKVGSESGESYRIYMAGISFNNTSDPNAVLLTTVYGDSSSTSYSYPYQVPIGRLGYGHYCVVIVDQFGAYSQDINPSSCDVVLEDAFNNWVAEPTNVQATFLGNGITRVTWNDQLGAEGEIYNIWRSEYRVQGVDFVENESLHWKGSVSDGIGTFDVTLEDGVIQSGIHYFVTSEARYGHISGTYHYTELQNNWAGPVSEDTEYPATADINSAIMIGELNTVTLIWQNSNEENEMYSIYRHQGDPFNGSEFGSSNYTDSGWELVNSSVPESSAATVVKSIEVPLNTQREVWYAIIISDEYSNTNPAIFPGDNAILVVEDTAVPTMDFEIRDISGTTVSGTALLKGDYTLRVASSEELMEDPLIKVLTSAGGDLSSGYQPMNDLPNNEYYFPISISSSTSAGDLLISIEMTDLAENAVFYNLSNYSIDAKAPTVNIFSPSSMNDGAKYLWGNAIRVTAGAVDDVAIETMQIRFIQNYGTGNSVVEPWRNVTGLTISEDGDWSIDMEFSAGNYMSGVHQVSVKAIDKAGNVRSASVTFVVDKCEHREDGMTICEHENPVPEDPGVIYPELNMTDPPYMITWITAGVSFFTVLVCLMVISTSMKGPKTKGDDEDEEEDWMSEFIGTSSEPDMEAITGGAPKEEKVVEPEEDDDEDPFAVNKTQQKRRRKKKDDDEGEDEDMEWEDGKSPKKKSKRKSPKRKAPKRKKKD